MIRNEINAPSIHDLNNYDFGVIHREVDLTPFEELIKTSLLEDPKWKEVVRQRKNKLSEMIKTQMSDLQSGVTTWAKFAASLSRAMGSDAPIIAGILCLTNKLFDTTTDLYKQITGYNRESGEVANQFIEKNFTERTIDDLDEVSAANK